MLRQGYYIVSAGGAGIGLAICREIAAQGGTAVALDPFNAPAEPGQGFCITPAMWVILHRSRRLSPSLPQAQWRLRGW